MIDAQTELYGIIGNPVRHSLSPIIHNGAFRRMGLNAVYLAFEVNDLEEAIGGVRELGLRGVSVTLPFKTQILPYLDQIEGVASKIRAVNTILNEGGRMIGHNTDWEGALQALETKVDLKGKRVILLGAGGAARAIGFGLKEKGCQVIIFNRSQNRAKILAKELGCFHHPLSSFEEMDGDILVNATSVGMYPLDAESPIPKEILEEGMVVMDIVYRPLQTRLLREAAERGCMTIDGLEMLAHQGAAQLEIWTGKKPNPLEIKNDLRRVLRSEVSLSGVSHD
ncbi:MAG: shikimate dehydrogenase [Deltaproteobacteria bacterium]|nr:shikimate dehydrogenase [Deltaproteobacteria bacterium]MBM4323740.1 shikimate dehydrogenase [Deltaproteobacteria bacterium]